MADTEIDNQHPCFTTTKDRILILGAGLAGLALAQALKHHDPPIPFTIFERDTPIPPTPPTTTATHTSQQDRPLRSQGYRIRISPSGASALRSLLPGPLWTAFVATSARVESGMNRVDAPSGARSELFGRGPGGWGRPSVAPKMPGAEEGEDSVDGRSFNVDRAVVRDLLLAGLEAGQDVVFGRRAVGFAVLPGGEGVEVQFADRGVERGAFLVGADGVRSIVRRKMLPGFRVLDTEGRAVLGKTVISREIEKEVPEAVFEGIAVCKDESERRMMLFCDPMRFDRAAAAEQKEAVGLKVPEDYVYWVLGFRKDVLDTPDNERELLHLSHEQSADLSLELTESWHESIRLLLQNQDKAASSTLAFTVSTTGFEQAWMTKPKDTAGLVALVGDAAHPMPPVGGVGATAAWQDAHDLFTATVAMQQTSDRTKRVEAVQAYEAKMLARAKPTVERSAGGLGHLMGTKPVGELKEVK